MYIINKELGKTPLEALSDFRNKKNKLKNVSLSYVGRLDPMAEGKMIIISGEENKNREKYLNFDKEYIAEFVIGASTDSLDVLGLIEKFYLKPATIEKNRIEKTIKRLKTIKSQKYPWLSGKTIGGVKMFEIFKSGKSEGIRRPINKIKIKNISDIKIGFIGKEKLKKEILEKIKKVKGDFRQKEIIIKWKEFFKNIETDKFQKFSFKIKVSSGTFIRGFAENLGRDFKIPVFLYRLKRTKIFSK